MKRHFAPSFLLICLLNISHFILAQNPQDQVSASTINIPYLQHLVKIKVDSVRQANGCEPLVNDSILYLASQHHNNYMITNKRFSHNEFGFDSTKTPQLRAEYYGAVSYGVGENILHTDYNGAIPISKNGKKTIQANTYESIATLIVESWVHSPGHFANIKTKSYQITGVAIQQVPGKEHVYACQTFAQVYYKYYFEESKTLFPYSTYKPKAVSSSFNGIDNQLQDHKHQWGLLHSDESNTCTNCRVISSNPPQLSLALKRNHYILRVENSKYVKELIKKRHDGFAVELVPFDDYMCGNPAYYEKPSRRNGQCQLNGVVLKPVYRKQLKKGYKKRHVEDNVNFLSYLVKADTVPFSKRIHEHQMSSFSSDYFEIDLGEIPDSLGGYLIHDLLYIQDKQICAIDYFTNYCGDVYFEQKKAERILFEYDETYEFDPKVATFNFNIPFEKGKSAFTMADIQPLLDTLKEFEFTIDSIDIKAKASPEGNPETNRLLAMKRSENIVSALQLEQEETIVYHIEGEIAWSALRASLNRSSEWRSYARKPQSELLELINQSAVKMESVLAPLRFASITLYYHIPATEKNLEYNISKEFDKLFSQIKSVRIFQNQKPEEFAKQTRLANEAIDKLNKLYRYANTLVSNNRLNPEFLAKQPYPNKLFNLGEISKLRYPINRLMETYVVSSYISPEVYKEYAPWIRNHSSFVEELLKTPEVRSHEFIYLYIQDFAEHFEKSKIKTIEDVQDKINELEKLERLYATQPVAKSNIERLNFNLNMILLSSLFVESPEERAGDAYESINEVYDWYYKNDEITDSVVYKLANTAVFYNNTQLALTLIQRHPDFDHSQAFRFMLNYRHPSQSWDDFYTELIRAAYEMDRSVWCNIFMSECGVPFQAFDQEQLRNEFCDKCMQHNDFIKSIR